MQTINIEERARLAKRMEEDLGLVKATFEGLAADSAMNGMANRILELIQEFEDHLTELLQERDQERINARAFCVVNALANLQTCISSLPDRYELLAASSIVTLTPTQAQKLVSTTTYLQPIINGISTELWSLVASLLKLKEWSINGGTTTGIYGLSNVRIQVTFG